MLIPSLTKVNQFSFICEVSASLVLGVSSPEYLKVLGSLDLRELSYLLFTAINGYSLKVFYIT